MKIPPPSHQPDPMAQLILAARAAFLLPCDPEDGPYWDFLRVAADPYVRMGNNRYTGFRKAGIMTRHVTPSLTVHHYNLTPQGSRLMAVCNRRAQDQIQWLDLPVDRKIAAAIVAHRSGYDSSLSRATRRSQTHWENLIRIGGSPVPFLGRSHTSIRVRPYHAARLTTQEDAIISLTPRGWQALNLHTLTIPYHAALTSHQGS